jgi:succinate dehydrogenase / fumarate reductase iron-sulfur subunit
MATATFLIWRGAAGDGRLADYTAEVSEGMVVLDAVHAIQATQAPDLACRWNCKAGKCGSCSAEINGQPRLMCMTRLNQLPEGQPITVEPMRAFPHVRDLVTDVSWNYEVKKRIKEFKPRPPDAPDGTWRMAQSDIDRVQEFRKCIECFLCQDVCHVLRDHHRGPHRRSEGCVRHRVLQHHQVLHQGLSGIDHDHRQRDHPAQRARRRSFLRSRTQAPACDQGEDVGPP